MWIARGFGIYWQISHNKSEPHVSIIYLDPDEFNYKDCSKEHGKSAPYSSMNHQSTDFDVEDPDTDYENSIINVIEVILRFAMGLAIIPMNLSLIS